MYQLYINSNSPYSVKSSALLGYAELPCEPMIQNLVTRYVVLKRLTGKTMVPVLRKGDWAINDSTQIARFAIEHSKASLLPRGEWESLCWILEDFADEWMVKWMVFSRWYHDRDFEKLKKDIGRELLWNVPVVGRLVGEMAARQIRGAAKKAGIHEGNREAFDASRKRLLQSLESLLEEGAPMLFGETPTVADFAFYGALFQYGRDPTGDKNLRLYPNVRGFVHRLDANRLRQISNRQYAAPYRSEGGGEREHLSELRDIFAEFLGTYWRYLVANYRVYSEQGAGTESSVTLLDGTQFSFVASGYHVGRLKFILGHIDRAYDKWNELIGQKGLELEDAMIQHVARLAEFESGRELLREYPNIYIEDEQHSHQRFAHG